MYKSNLFLLMVLGVVTMATAQFSLPVLPYSYDALEPFIDKQTMEIHYTKHHDAYIKNLNKEVENLPILGKLSVEEICKNISKYNIAIRNNAGGHYNHTFFWNNLSPAPSKPSAKLMAEIEATFGSMDKMKEEFSNAAKSRFGSGWAWLVVVDGKLKISSTPNQDNPLMDIAEVKGKPLLALDVWEHAYYLKYQNKRVDYIAAFWNIVNWQEVSKRFEN